MTLEPLERRIEMARRHQRAALVMIGFAVALMVTLLSSSFALSLVGAGGLFASGMVVGYQAARIDQVAAAQPPVNKSHT
jgi:fructose-specific phosphotransferase system IIC component